MKFDLLITVATTLLIISVAIFQSV